jgi:hypothetical protein
MKNASLKSWAFSFTLYLPARALVPKSRAMCPQITKFPIPQTPTRIRCRFAADKPGIRNVRVD